MVHFAISRLDDNASVIAHAVLSYEILMLNRYLSYVLCFGVGK